jgi:beta-aspartyl-peptidase (threonine type)
MNKNKIALAVHGGAGTIERSSMSEDLEREYRTGLQNALGCGWEILQSGGSANDAVEASVVELENCPLFNAGRGAVFAHDGKNEMDACLMDGKTGKAGAVAFVRNIKNPIKLARAVMEKTEHVLLAGDGATEFARTINAEFEPDDYFFTDLRYQQFLKARAQGVIELDHTKTTVKNSKSKIKIPKAKNQKPKTEDPNANRKTQITNRKSLGTVGAVACDVSGNIAAATSTGGMTNKKFGRIGDTPIVGAGTYADNQTCAVSCTGHGEFFMRAVAAYDVAALMKYRNLSLKDAAREVVGKLQASGGEGGLIAVDALGNLALPFNSDGMYRAFIASGDKPAIDIYRNFPLLKKFRLKI